MAATVRQVLKGRTAIWATHTKVRDHRKGVIEAFTERENQRKVEMKEEKKKRQTDRKIKREQKKRKRKRKERKKEVLVGLAGSPAP